MVVEKAAVNVTCGVCEIGGGGVVDALVDEVIVNKGMVGRRVWRRVMVGGIEMEETWEEIRVRVCHRWKTKKIMKKKLSGRWESGNSFMAIWVCFYREREITRWLKEVDGGEREREREGYQTWGKR